MLTRNSSQTKYLKLRTEERQHEGESLLQYEASGINSNLCGIDDHTMDCPATSMVLASSRKVVLQIIEFLCVSIIVHQMEAFIVMFNRHLSNAVHSHRNASQSTPFLSTLFHAVTAIPELDRSIQVSEALLLLEQQGDVLRIEKLGPWPEVVQNQAHTNTCWISRQYLRRLELR